MTRLNTTFFLALVIMKTTTCGHHTRAQKSSTPPYGVRVRSFSVPVSLTIALKTRTASIDVARLVANSSFHMDVEIEVLDPLKMIEFGGTDDDVLHCRLNASLTTTVYCLVQFNIDRPAPTQVSS
ncbi:hypothetical protein Plhal304r1_c031g0101241 [Plasmopara halstedii]